MTPSPPELPGPAHWAGEELRRHGYAVVDWLVEHLARLEELAVQPAVAPGEVRALLPGTAPEHGEPFAAVLADLQRIVVPRVTQWQHPGFFAYFPGNASPPSMLADLVSSGLGVQGMLWSTGPAATEVEQHVLDWLVDLLDLPPAFRFDAAGGGAIQESASSATLVALLAAREQATGGDTNARGMGRPLAVYASEHAHSSLEKAVRIAGLGSAGLRLVPTDAAHALDVAALDTALKEDVAAGITPVMVMATVGSTSSTAIDPVAAIGALCARERVWLHVDGAYAGSAAICEELRFVNAGLELADSYAFNPHKWLLTNFDCTALYVRDRAALIDALTVVPEYLRNRATESGAVVDYRDWQIPLGRRFRALKLWFVLRSYGAEGLRAHIRRHVAWARWLADRVDEHPHLELAAPAPLGLVCLRHRAGDTATQALLDAANATGRFFLTHTRLDDRLVARVAIGGTFTEARHIADLWRILSDAALP